MGNSGKANDPNQTLRDEVARTQEERDHYRSELEALKASTENSISTSLRLLSRDLAEEVRQKFYARLQRTLWGVGILLAVATGGGLWTLSDRIDRVVTDEVAKRDKDIAKLRENVIDAVVEFRTDAAKSLNEIEEDLKRVDEAGNQAISEFKSNAEAALAEIEREKARVKSAANEATALISVRVSNIQKIPTSDASNTGIIVIPIVVHVIYHTNEQNISDAQVNSQIKVLNQDFRAKNPDLSKVPDPFKSLVGDARIEFELARIDPDGMPTSGITRTKTPLAKFSYDLSSASSSEELGALIKHDKTGKSAWPHDRYLNIWVVDLRGGLLSLNQSPGGPAETDGIVVHLGAFGTSGAASAPFDKGRTTTQSVAKWLGLRNVWGDDFGGCDGSDGIDDTPNQAGPNVGKPVFPAISCGNEPNGDMFMNFLDYADDDTMVMFTKGQVAHMRKILLTVRNIIGRP